jgi:hypothetical protein
MCFFLLNRLTNAAQLPVQQFKTFIFHFFSDFVNFSYSLRFILIILHDIIVFFLLLIFFLFFVIAYC